MTSLQIQIPHIHERTHDTIALQITQRNTAYFSFLLGKAAGN